MTFTTLRRCFLGKSSAQTTNRAPQMLMSRDDSWDSVAAPNYGDHGCDDGATCDGSSSLSSAANVALYFAVVAPTSSCYHWIDLCCFALADQITSAPKTCVHFLLNPIGSKHFAPSSDSSPIPFLRCQSPLMHLSSLRSARFSSSSR